MDQVLIIFQTILLVSVLYFIFRRDSEERKKELEINKFSNSFLVEIQKEYFKNIEKQNSTSLKIIKEQSVEFAKQVKALQEILVPKVNVVKEEPVKIDTFKLANDIEKEDEEEIDLADSNRIPMINGIKLQFEDEEGEYPINISPVGNVAPSFVDNGLMDSLGGLDGSN